MDLFALVKMIGGLAFFLYGMHLMEEGLCGLAGGRMERLLSRLTNSPGKAVLAGGCWAAAVQSSSAATVMVVGLVDSGMLKLQQAAEIIMGANIGTTLTPWLLGTVQSASASPLARALSPACLASVLSAVGVGLLYLAKEDRARHTASALLGFAILMFGMENMCGAVQPLAEAPEFGRRLIYFADPLRGMLAGLLLTAVIQSSSASVGMLQALCATGAISYGTVLPIVMGQNIGTCATAVLASAGGGKNAKRAALVHLYFNVTAAVLFMGCFCAIRALAPLAVLDQAASPFGIALVHSGFNLVAVIALLPCSKQLVRLACRSVSRSSEAAV